jgi:hypothetical protein
MTTIFVLYFVPMLLWYAVAAYCFYKDWYDGEDIKLSDILLGFVLGLVPPLNLVCFIATCWFLCANHVKHIKIKGRKQ